MMVGQPAIAEIRQLPERADQMLYQSRQTLQDQNGKTWQVVLFKRVKPDQPSLTHLRLVGFPGITVTHPHPLLLAAGSLELSASDDFAEQSPSPNVGQYDLTEIIPQLPGVNFLRLNVPTLEQPVELRVPFFVLQEWKELNQR
ncbi:DUF3122 domain-containing protein [Spirulina subsalsa FACHB-351]|uniref:DUF3122 domain-containing protein n=1 Tax=Spirulina subsalsa FACHB-351 TaxID=234711 RepID=A0ABT3L2D7_9CYAN|nr:DUF3122 domain-containing protein [Spirulina subsalsa]MCW6035668.1 DUF3122 domain-containing protein [Spirulina subsalsa FACHB-351]